MSLCSTHSLVSKKHFEWLPLLTLYRLWLLCLCMFFAHHRTHLTQILWQHSSNTKTNIHFGNSIVPIWKVKFSLYIHSMDSLSISYNQLKHHKILANLRSTTHTNKQKKNYSIPGGGWFEMISCPHYFAEIIIYFAFVVFFGMKNVSMWYGHSSMFSHANSTSRLIFVFVIANLTHTATQTHDWYLKIFDDYPKNRRIIIPFVY